MMTEMTPEQAIDRYARHGDAEAFALLVRRYGRVAYAAAARKLARSEDVEDATQQAFLNLARAAGTVRRDVAAWLYRAAQHAAIDLIRRDAIRRRHESAVDAAGPSEPRDAAAWRELSAAVDDAIAALPEDERSLVVEHFLAGRSQAELAAALDVNQATVSRRLAAAVERLRDELAKRGHASLGAAAIAAHLPQLGAADVPTTLAGELTKIGLAAPAKAAGLSLAATAGLAVAAIALAAGVAGLAVVAGQPRGTAATNAAPTYTDANAALVALATTYKLDAGQDIASFPPPFPPARSAYVDLQFPHANGSSNVNSVGFTLGPAGLSNRYMRYPDPDLKSTIEVFLDVPWHAYDVSALASLDWRPGRSDWVVRDGLTVEQKLAALATFVGDRAGRPFHFERRMERRPCVVHAGTSDRATPQNSGHIGTAYVALDPPTPDLLARLAAYDVPKGTRHAFQFDVASRWLDAPFFWADERDPQLDTRIFYVPATTQLSRSDPDYRAKLRRVIDNVAGQLGGTWTIEDRDVETWVAVVGERPATAAVEVDQAALAEALKLLGETYRVPAGADVAVFAPPHSFSRDAFVRAFVPNAAGREVKSVGLRWDGDDQVSVLSPQMASFDEPDAREWFAWAMVFDNVAAHAYDVDAIVATGWRPGGRDVVLRDNLPVEARLRALAAVAARDLGREITFERRVEMRPCVVLSGDLRALPPGETPQATLTLGTPDPGAANARRIDEACKWIDAPFVGREHRFNFQIVDYRLCADARLSRADPNFRAKLQRVLDGLARQLGGTWTIEDREIETWVASVATSK